MFFIGLLLFTFLVSGLKIGSMMYDIYRKPINYLRKNHYNMKAVYERRRRYPSWVRESERHLYQKRLSKSIYKIHFMRKTKRVTCLT